MSRIKAGIIGGAGYTGGELIRILLRHPGAEIAFVHSKSNAGNPLYKAHSDLLGETDLAFTSELDKDVDVLFLCQGHGEARKFLDTANINPAVKVIDLSNDFRLADGAAHGERTFTYGLPELNRDAITKADNIGNPGCFATAIQLGLLPLAKAGLLQEVNTTGITGSTGAGQGLSATSHFSWRANNIQAYKTLEHQHIGEIRQSLEQLQGDKVPGIYFVPWRGDFTRGIYISSVLSCDKSQAEILNLYKDFYAGAAFTHVSDSMIDLKSVVNTNKCIIYPEKVGEKLIVHSAIDNLLKGASGQAVQNMNLMCGLEENTGLKLKASSF
jgi:N-acetyl-gamma-glutamyl-phosphate reductase